MSAEENIAINTVSRFRERFEHLGYYVSDIRKENYSYSIDIEDGNEKAKLIVYFGKKGIKTIVQGNSSGTLIKNLNSELFGEKLINDNDNFKEPDVYIGTDESGKGDYFGPLVTAGVLVDSATKSLLLKIGVRDSKELSDSAVKVMAVKIKKIVTDKFSIVGINPEKYNTLYEKIGNVNNLLGWAHARVIENILDKNKVEDAISDKFGNSKTILNSLMEKGKTINLHQENKAEKYTAVAAASIIARTEVVNWFERASKKYKMEIPKGASSQVDSIAIKLKEKIGEAELQKLVKLHFKTSKKIF